MLRRVRPGVSLTEYLTILRDRLWQLTAVVLVAVAFAAGVSALTRPVYDSKATIFFSSSDAQSARGVSGGLLYAQSLVRSYARAAVGPLILDPVIRQLNLNMTASELARHVRALNPLGTVVIEIHITDSSPERSTQIADQVARQLALSIDDLTPSGLQERAPMRVRTVALATVPEAPAAPRTRLTLALALVLGVLGGAVLVLWLETLDPRIRSRRDLARLTAFPVLGMIPGPKGRLPRPAFLHSARLGPERGRLRTNFLSLREEGSLRTLLLVSPSVDRASAWAASALGPELTRAEERLIVVDADLTAASRLPATAGPGLSEVLRGRATLDEAIRRGPANGQALLPAGAPIDDPGAALESSAMRDVLRRLGEQYDIVLIRAAALQHTSAALAVAGIVDGVVVVGDRKATAQRSLRRALQALQLVRAPVRGVILLA